MQARLIVLIFTLTTSTAFAQMIRVNDTPTDGIPEEYLVEKGDTLWDICDFYFRDARRWPSVWALNPHVTNPHWIYPGDILRLRMPLPAGEPGSKTPVFKVATGIETARQISLNEGFIGAGEDPTVGRVDSSRETHRYLAEGDEVYLKLKNKDEVRIGSQFSIFQPLGAVVHPTTEAVLGQKVRMKGIVKVTGHFHNALHSHLLTQNSFCGRMNNCPERLKDRKLRTDSNLIFILELQVDLVTFCQISMGFT